MSLSSLKQEQRSHQTPNGPNLATSSQPNKPTQPPPPQHHHRNIKKKKKKINYPTQKPKLPLAATPKTPNPSI